MGLYVLKRVNKILEGVLNKQLEEKEFVVTDSDVGSGTL